MEKKARVVMERDLEKAYGQFLVELTRKHAQMKDPRIEVIY